MQKTCNERPGAIPRVYKTPIWVVAINRLRTTLNLSPLRGQQECQIAESFQVFLYIFSAIFILALLFVFIVNFFLNTNDSVKFFAVSIFTLFAGFVFILKKLC